MGGGGTVRALVSRVFVVKGNRLKLRQILLGGGGGAGEESYGKEGVQGVAVDGMHRLLYSEVAVSRRLDAPCCCGGYMGVREEANEMRGSNGIDPGPHP